jgi:hypothetical protein
MRTAVLLLVLGAIACNAKGETGVAAMEKWSETICACKDLACAQEATLAMKKELDAIESRSKGKVSDTQVKRLVELGDGIARCIAEVKARATERTWSADADQRAKAATKVMTAHAKKICACKSSACVAQQRTAWAEAMKPYSEGSASVAAHPTFLAGAAAATQQLEACKPPT